MPLSEPRRKRVSPRDPSQEWWIPQAPAKEAKDSSRSVAMQNFYEVCKTCIEDEIDQDVFDCILIANLSLRVAAAFTGIPKTTLARRRDLLRARIGETVRNDSGLWADLLVTSSINE
jgi:hypothetical protein